VLSAVNVTGVPTRIVPAASLTVKARVTAPPSGPVAAVEISDSVVVTVFVGEVVTVTVAGAFPAPNVTDAVSVLVEVPHVIVAETVEVNEVVEVEVSVKV
jgi:hypothetical protein